MSRPPSVIPGVKLCFHLPQDVKAKLALHLYSPSEQRIPHGAYSVFLVQLIRTYFNNLKDSSDAQSNDT